jgi:hypothetical protein
VYKNGHLVGDDFDAVAAHRKVGRGGRVALAVRVGHGVVRRREEAAGPERQQQLGRAGVELGDVGHPWKGATVDRLLHTRLSLLNTILVGGG